MKNAHRKKRTLWLLLGICMLSPVSLFLFVVGSKVYAAHLAAIESAYTPKLCKSLHRAGGFAKTSLSMAEMSAIVEWSREASRYGQDFNFWTNADKRVLRCIKVRNTVLYNCIASATPCRILHDRAEQIQVAERPVDTNSHLNWINFPVNIPDCINAR